LYISFMIPDSTCNTMRSKAMLWILLFTPIALLAQYEQKVSINLSAGAFNTFGDKIGEYDPRQMPNYQTGFSARGGVQFRISAHLALAAEAGFMVTQRWYYSESGDCNYMDWAFEDTVTFELIAEGTNYLDLYNYSLGLRPVCYLFESSRWNPYLFAGVHCNYTTCCYEDTQWMEHYKRGMLPHDDTGPFNPYLESNLGIGFNPGLGIEYSAGSWVHLFLDAGYYYVALQGKNFKCPEMEEHLNAVTFHLGGRFFFIKTRDL
jgi:hypothetical protein